MNNIELKEITHEYECDECHKPATVNVSNVWKKYDIDKEGDFQERQSWDGDTSEFYCDECYEKGKEF